MLTDLLWSLADDERHRVSSLRIWRDIHRGWVVTLSYAGMMTVEGDAGQDLARHTVDVDHSPMPGVDMAAWMRRPDTVHEMPALAGADPHNDVLRAVRALHASGLVGGLDASRYESDTLDAMTRAPFPAWLIKTHAGSDAERAAWVLSIDD